MPETHLTQIMQAVCSTLSELCLEEPSLRPKLCKGGQWALGGVFEPTRVPAGFVSLKKNSVPWSLFAANHPSRQGLRQLATAKSPSPAAEVELLFAIAKIYGGNFPLDMMAYSWQLATRSSQAAACLL